LETDIEEYMENFPDLNKDETLQEYLKSKKSNTIEVEIHSKLGIDTYDIETLNTILLGNIESICIHNKLIGELMKMVIVNNKVIVRDMKELREAELDDLYSSDNWIYHRDWKPEDVINYVRRENDTFRKEDEYEEENEDNLK
jgi:hypothetical protein